MKRIDLSHTVEHGMVTYPGLAPPVVCDYWTRGEHGPFHRYADAFAGLEVYGKAVLVHTGWSRHWCTDAYLQGHPHLTAAAAGFRLHAVPVKVKGMGSFPVRAYAVIDA